MQHSISRERWEGETIEKTKLRACEGQLRALENVPWIHYLKLKGT
jgi:hypothetical protein